MLATLKQIDASKLRTVGGPDLIAAYNAAVGLDHDRALVTRPGRIDAKRQLQLTGAANAIDALPAPGECWHRLVMGNRDHYGYVARLIELCGAPIPHLRLLTLSYSRDNAAALIALLDAGTIGRLSVVCSVYFRAQERATFDSLAQPMQARGQRILAGRMHAKVALIPAAPNYITIAGSANLRPYRNCEQFCIFNDQATHDFYAEALDFILDQAERSAGK